MQTRSEVFEQQTWHTLEPQLLSRREQERILGSRLSDLLFPEHESLFAFSSVEERRRHHWNDLLGFPLLLSLLKQLAMPNACGGNELDGIRDRFTLYTKVARHLLLKGLRTTDGIDLQQQEVRLNRILGEVAIHMVQNHNFDVLEGEEFDEWLESKGNSLVRELVQENIVSFHRVLDRLELQDVNDSAIRIRRGLEWRHRSFLEFFAGRALADLWRENPTSVQLILRDVHNCLDGDGNWRVWKITKPETGEQQSLFRNLPADWHWTLRFFLAALDDCHRNAAAVELICCGNPWIVYESIDSDGVSYSADVDTLVRWLVSRNRRERRDFSEALDRKVNNAQSTLVSQSEATLALDNLVNSRSGLVAEMLAPETRDAGMLNSLRDLTRFSADDQPFQRWKTVTIQQRNALDEFLSPERWVSGIPGHPGIQMSDFPVTNAVFEAFCASQRRDRDKYSSEDDQPVLQVSWFMAQEFCAWLSEVRPGFRYFLPDDVVWQAACRWNTPQGWNFCWGKQMNDQLCWYGGRSAGGPVQSAWRTRSRREAIRALETAGIWHPSGTSSTQPGFLDMSGNVWEWCENRCDVPDATPGSSRVLRGGSWYDDADHCRPGWQAGFTPDCRFTFIGFRLCVE